VDPILLDGLGMNPNHEARTLEGRASHGFGGGIVAGLVAGIVLAVAMIAMAIANHGDPWIVLKGAGTPFLHDRAAQPGFDASAVALGVLVHLAIAIAWGAVFGLVCYGIPKAATIVAGMAYGVIVWLVMYHLVLPAVGMGEVAASRPLAAAILAHVGFGLVLAIVFLPFQRTRPQAPPVTRAPVAS
jgi:Family of unknown function (DUF6789)